MWRRGFVVGLLLVLCAAAPVEVYLFNQPPTSAWLVYVTDTTGTETPLGLFWTWGTPIEVVHSTGERAAPGILHFTVPEHITAVRTVPHYDVMGDTSITAARAPDAQVELRIWPNPSSGTVTIDATEAGVYRLYNVRGQRVAAVPMTKGENVVKLDVPSGVYYFRHKRTWGRLVRVQ